MEEAKEKDPVYYNVKVPMEPATVCHASQSHVAMHSVVLLLALSAVLVKRIVVCGLDCLFCQVLVLS
jgi:hypothetical protein